MVTSLPGITCIAWVGHVGATTETYARIAIDIHTQCGASLSLNSDNFRCGHALMTVRHASKQDSPWGPWGDAPRSACTSHSSQQGQNVNDIDKQ